MVVSLTGKINGEIVSLERTNGDQWVATIPSSLNGTYVVELTATDEAGNTAYCARYILTIDFTALCVDIRPYDYAVDMKNRDFDAVLRADTYIASVRTGE